MKKRFRGSYVLKVDEKGRVKLPSKYFSIFNDRFGREIYITSLNGDHVLLYPMQIWEKIEENIERIKIRSPEVDEYVSRTSFWGNESDIDSRGRILIPPNLRKKSNLLDDVCIIGKIDYLVIWNEEQFKKISITGSFTDEKLHQVSRIINEFSTLSSDE